MLSADSMHHIQYIDPFSASAFPEGFLFVYIPAGFVEYNTYLAALSLHIKGVPHLLCLVRLGSSICSFC